jgi:hypothetical protein
MEYNRPFGEESSDYKDLVGLVKTGGLDDLHFFLQPDS